VATRISHETPFQMHLNVQHCVNTRCRKINI